MEDKLIREHSLYKYADDVADLCKELLTNTPINLFCIGRAYYNGDYGGLLSDKGWAYHYLKNDLQQLGAEHQMAAHNQDYTFWNLTSVAPRCQKSQILYDALIQFKHGSGVVFATDYSEFREACFITTSNDSYSTDPVLVENINFLKRFILYFKEKIYSDKRLYQAFCVRYQNEISDPEPMKIFEQTKPEFPVHKYYLGGPFNDIAFSQREAECLKCIVIGKTAKQIAKYLGLSPRTVETHLEKIKLKTECKTLPELIQKLEKCSLLDGI